MKELKMKSDEVIDEIRSVREKLSAQYGHDIHKHLEHLREKESSSQQKILKPSDKILPEKKSA